MEAVCAVVTRRAAVGAEDRAVVHFDQHDVAASLVAIPAAPELRAGHRDRHRSGNVHQRRERMRVIIAARQPVAPVLRARRIPEAVLNVHRMIVLPLGIANLADFARIVQSLEFLTEARVAVILRQHIAKVCFLRETVDLHALGEGHVRARLGQHVLSGFQRELCEMRVGVERRGDYDRVEILMNEFVEIVIAGNIQFIADLVQTVLEIVADRNQLHSGSGGGLCERLSAERAQDADADIALGDRIAHGFFLLLFTASAAFDSKAPRFPPACSRALPSCGARFR